MPKDIDKSAVGTGSKKTAAGKDPSASARPGSSLKDSTRTRGASVDARTEKSPSSRTSDGSSSPRSSRGGRPSKKTRKKRSVGMVILLSLRNVLIALLLIALLIGLIVAGIVAGALFGYVETIDPIDINQIKLNMTSMVYVTDPDGNTVEVERLYDNENRIWVDLDDIPEDLQNAFIAIEDERFWSHKGVDIKRTLGAAVTYVYNKVRGTDNHTFGGSTLTQQLIKNLTGEKDYRPERKIQEIYRAFKLENELSKEEILEYYLNTIYLSQQCNGVSSAANTYFGKSVSQLTLAECACIAGITQSPTKYDPYQNPKNNKARQEVVLGKMLELGKITQSEYDAAVKEELSFVPLKTEEEITYNSYYVDAAINQIIADLMTQYGYTKDIASRVLFNAGLKIYLAQDTEIQKIMDDVYADPSSFQKGRGEVQPQSAMVIMDPYTGQVKALCGGRGDKEGNLTLNRATQSTRQPGSTIKPVAVYGPAIEYGLITPSTVINDAPVTYNGWSPKNVDGRFKGNVSARNALANSRNVPAVKVCRYLGVENSFKYLSERLHVSTLDPVNDMDLAPMALGGLTNGVSVLELTAAYCAFVNDGFYNKPLLYTKVEDASGNIILDGKPTNEIAMSENTAADVISMMKDVVSYGSGTMANFSGMEIAGKTGTTGTSTSNDRWFVGATPYYVGAVWFGYDQPKDLTGFSSNPAALAWKKVMQPVHKDLAYRDFEKPGSEVSVMICRESGQRANPDCEHVTSEMYSKNKIPKTRCELHPLKAGSKNTLSEGRKVSSGSSGNKSSDDDDDDDKDDKKEGSGEGTGSDTGTGSGEGSGTGTGTGEGTGNSGSGEGSGEGSGTGTSGAGTGTETGNSGSGSGTGGSETGSGSTGSSDSGSNGGGSTGGGSTGGNSGGGSDVPVVTIPPSGGDSGAGGGDGGI